MKIRAFLFAIAILHSLLGLSQDIDSLRTDAQVLSFVRKLFKNNGRIHILPPKPVDRVEDDDLKIRQFGSLPYEKADFDDNGHADLLFNGYIDYSKTNHACSRICFVILSFGKDSFRIKELTQGMGFGFLTARKIELEGKKCIEGLKIGGHYIDSIKYAYHSSKDTLIYLYDDFIERSSPNDHKIEKIGYCALTGFETIPALKLSIVDTIATLEIQRSAREPLVSSIDSGGAFQTRLDPMIYQKILGLLHHIDFPGLNDSYAVNWTDDAYASLKITYDNGKMKKIEDYGLIGTYGLASLHSILIELRNTQHWTRIKSGDGYYLFGCN